MCIRDSTETAVGSNVIIHSTPIATQLQLNESAVDSGIQLTPVLTNKNKQSDDSSMLKDLYSICLLYTSLTSSLTMLNQQNTSNLVCYVSNVTSLSISDI